MARRDEALNARNTTDIVGICQQKANSVHGLLYVSLIQREVQALVKLRCHKIAAVIGRRERNDTGSELVVVVDTYEIALLHVDLLIVGYDEANKPETGRVIDVVADKLVLVRRVSSPN